MLEKIQLRSKIELDSLRFISIFLVVYHHQFLTSNSFFLWTKNYAWIGVDIFFVLSGYIITTHLKDEFYKNQSINLFRFWIKRVWRLWPHLYFTLFLTTPVLWYFGKNNPEIMESIKQSYWHYFVHIANYSHGVFGRLHTLTSHFWSLSVEEHFYFLWPLCLIFILKKPKFTYVTLCLLFFLPLIFRIYHGISGESYEFIKLSTHTRFDELIAGCALAFLPRPKTTLTLVPDLLLWALCFGLFYIGTSLLDDRFTPYPLAAFNFSVLALASALLIFLAENGHPKSLRFLLKNSTMARLGILSYNIYLIHFLVIIVFYGLNTKLFQIKSQELTSSLVFIICIVLGFFMYLTLDKWVESKKKKL